MNLNRTKDKKRTEIEQQFLYLLAKIVETFPQYTLSQHLSHMLRRKTEPVLAYYWEDTLTLQKIEQYYDELKNDPTQNAPIENKSIENV